MHESCLFLDMICQSTYEVFFLIFRRLWKCKVGMVERQHGREVRHQGDEEEGDHRQQACGPHREREEDPRIIRAPIHCR